MGWQRVGHDWATFTFKVHKVHLCYSMWHRFLLFKGWLIFHCACVDHIFSMHLSVDGHWVFSSSWPMIKAAMNMTADTSFRLGRESCVLLSKWLRGGITGSYGFLFLYLIFLGTSIMFSRAVATFKTSTNSVQGFQFLYILVNPCSFLFLLPSSHPDEYAAVSHVFFWFTFFWWLVILSIFLCACWPFVCGESPLVPPSSE